MTRTDYINALRRIADVYQVNPDLEAPAYIPASWVFAATPEAFIRYVRAFGGGGKEFKGEDLEFTPEYCGDIIKINCKREQICERKVVGSRHVPEKIIPAQIVPAHEEEIVEWDCKPILARRPVTVDIPRTLEEAPALLTSVNAPAATQSEDCATAQSGGESEA
jgi:hypothetical protein